MFCFLSTRWTPGSRVRKRAHPVAISWLVILSLVINSLPVLAFADDKPASVLSQTSKKLPDLDINKIGLDPVKIAAAGYFQEHQDQVLAEIRTLAIALEKKLDQKRVELGAEKMDDMINKGAKDTLMVTDDAIGKAEPTTIDNIRITRVVHEASGIVFAIVPSELKMDTPHWKRFLGRQNTVSGKDGRPVIIVQLESTLEAFTSNSESWIGDIGKLDYKPKPTTRRERLSSSWDAIWAGHPDRSMVGLAALFTGGQVMISAVLGGVQAMQNGHAFTDLDARPAILSAFFGMVIGSYASTWKNFTNMPKSKFQRTLRNALLSYAFAYSLTIWMDGGVHNLSIVDPQGIFVHSMIWLNVIVNNYTKDAWGWFTRIREDMGMNRGYVDGKVLGRFKFKKTSYEYQRLNLGSYTLKMLDLVHFSVPMAMLSNMDVPLGKALFISSALWVQYLALNYAKKLGYERTGEIRAQLMDTLTLAPVRRFVVKMAKSVARAVAKSPSVCTALLTGRPLHPPINNGDSK